MPEGHKEVTTHNGFYNILRGAAAIIAAGVIYGGVATYGDVQEMKGNRFTVEDYLNSEILRRAEANAKIDSVETRMKTEWLAGLARIEAKIDQLSALHMEYGR